MCIFPFQLHSGGGIISRLVVAVIPPKVLDARVVAQRRWAGRFCLNKTGCCLSKRLLYVDRGTGYSYGGSLIIPFLYFSRGRLLVTNKSVALAATAEICDR